MTASTLTRPDVPTVNFELMWKVFHHIEDHPELWEQENWRTTVTCGTAYCFAGWTVTLTGATWLSGISLLADGSDPDAERVTLKTGAVVVNVSNRAARLLGLDADEATGLFAAGLADDLEALYTMVEQIAGPEIPRQADTLRTLTGVTG